MPDRAHADKAVESEAEVFIEKDAFQFELDETYRFRDRLNSAAVMLARKDAIPTRRSDGILLIKRHYEEALLALTPAQPDVAGEQRWEPVTEHERHILHLTFQRSARHRGKLPDAVYVVRQHGNGFIRSAMQYIEDGKWERWGIQTHPANDICESWSTIMSWLRPLIGDRAAIEVYPREHDVLNTAPIRWFWVVPTDKIPSEYDLNAQPTTPPASGERELPDGPGVWCRKSAVVLVFHIHEGSIFFYREIDQQRGELMGEKRAVHMLPLGGWRRLGADNELTALRQRCETAERERDRYSNQFGDCMDRLGAWQEATGCSYPTAAKDSLATARRALEMIDKQIYDVHPHDSIVLDKFGGDFLAMNIAMIASSAFASLPKQE